jgi:hypothetical protein
VKKFLSLLPALALIAVSAQASIIYTFEGMTPSGTPGQNDFTYLAQLSADQRINDAVGPNFGVVFDIDGFVSAFATSLVSGVTVTTSVENLTSPQPAGTSAPDDAALPNVRTNIAGSFTGSGLTSLYTVVITSTLDATTLGFQSAQAVKFAPGDLSDNTLSGNRVMIELPTTSPASDVPEPGTMCLVGLALAGVASLKRRVS